MAIYKAPDESGDKFLIPSDTNERAQFVAAVKERCDEDVIQLIYLHLVCYEH